MRAYFPIKWKEGCLITIPKSKKATREVGSLRPITLFSIFGKGLEYLIRIRILGEILEALNMAE